MRKAAYSTTAPKQTVSLTVNSDLYAKAKSAGINASRVAEQALADAYLTHCQRTAQADIAAELQALEQFTREHGDFPSHVREFTRDRDEAV